MTRSSKDNQINHANDGKVGAPPTSSPFPPRSGSLLDRILCQLNRSTQHFV